MKDCWHGKVKRTRPRPITAVSRDFSPGVSWSCPRSRCIAPMIQMQHEPRRAANMAKPFQAPIHRRKFTFRVEPERHAAFSAAADEMGISRQELLTRALDSYLETREAAPGDQPVHDDSLRLARHHEPPTMLQLPF
jgi:hypothetical protein